MVVEETGTERTDYKVMPLKGLMHGRGLMYPACDGLEVMNAERIRVTTPIPANDIKRMMPVMNAIHSAFFLHLNKEIPFFIDRSQPLRPADIPFAIGRMLQQLPIRA